MDAIQSSLSAPSRQIELRPVTQLNPYPKNARTHSDEQIAQIAASLRKFGFTNPILVDEAGGIIAGHGRLLAARLIGMSEVPCITLAGLTEAQRRAYIIADNKIALNAGWDFVLLRGELEQLDHENFELGLTGFSDAEIEQIMTWVPKAEGLTDPDELPSETDPIASFGDLWLCGRHRILCGDSTATQAVAVLLRESEPNLMVTDPPYGVKYDPAWRNRALRTDGTPIGAFAISAVSNDHQADWEAAWRLFTGDVAYCWHAGVEAAATQQAFENCGFELRSQIIWAKQHFPIGRGHYHVQHEPCFYLVRKGATGHWNADRKQTTLWQIDKPIKNETGHSTQKPVECMRRPIANNSKSGDLVYDPFLGSGTTLIAAEMEGRTCLGMEIEPKYVDVAVQRWERFTGKKATLERQVNSAA